jgi:heme-degrading monooxygenase HmoA
MSIWTFKKGQREKGLDFLTESSSDAARNTEGFKGFIDLRSEEAVDCATIITLWESDEARKESSSGLFKDATKGLEQYLECPPEVSNYILSDGEIRL